MRERTGKADGTHGRNLSTVLQLVHERRGLSRATLTQHTGLNRSTIAALVAELSEFGLVVERAPDPTNRVGRPSAVVDPAPSVCAIAVNPEIDAITIGAVGFGGRVIVRERIEVDHIVSAAETAAAVADRLNSWRATVLLGHRIVGIGLAVPALVRASDGMVRWAPHLGWRDESLKELVESATGFPAAVGNDASLGALAEHLFGAGRGVDDMVYLNGGASGIGGGVIVHGIPVGGAGGYAGEFGQNRPGIAAPGDRQAGAGVLEDEVSRARLLSAVGLQSADEPRLAAALAASKNPAVQAELDRQRRILSTALSNAINVLNPALVVLGGFLATIAEHGMPQLEALVAEQTVPAAVEHVSIRVAELGENRLMIGAAEIAFAGILADPSA